MFTTVFQRFARTSNRSLSFCYRTGLERLFRVQTALKRKVVSTKSACAILGGQTDRCNTRVQRSLATYDGKLISRQRLSVLRKCLFEEFSCVTQLCPCKRFLRKTVWLFDTVESTVSPRAFCEEQGNTTDTVSYECATNGHPKLDFNWTIASRSCRLCLTVLVNRLKSSKSFERSIAIIYMSACAPSLLCSAFDAIFVCHSQSIRVAASARLPGLRSRFATPKSFSLFHGAPLQWLSFSAM